MIHLGDITKISGYEVPIVDCVIGGSLFLFYFLGVEKMENRDKISRKEVLRLLKKDRLKAAGKTITISGVVYVLEEYIRNIIKATKGV